MLENDNCFFPFCNQGNGHCYLEQICIDNKKQKDEGLPLDGELYSALITLSNCPHAVVLRVTYEECFSLSKQVFIAEAKANSEIII
jgi:hypothetical protein